MLDKLNERCLIKIGGYLNKEDTISFSFTNKYIHYLIYNHLMLTKLSINGYDLSNLKSLRKFPSNFKFLKSINVNLKICLFKPQSLSLEIARGIRQLPQLENVSLSWDQPLHQNIYESICSLSNLKSLHLIFFDTLELGLEGKLFNKCHLRECSIQWFPRDAAYGLEDKSSNASDPSKTLDPKPLPPPSPNEFINLFAFISQFSTTLKKLHLGPLPLEVNDENIQISYINLFRNLLYLEHLEIYSIERSYIMIPAMIKEEEQEKFELKRPFKNLKKLKFLDRPPSTNDGIFRYSKFLKDVYIGGVLESDELAFTLIDLRDKQIENFTISVYVNDDDSLQRLCYSIPTLKFLDIAFVFYGVEDIPSHYWPNTVINCLSTLPYLKKLVINFNLDLIYNDPSPLALPNTLQWQEWNKRSLMRYDKASAAIAHACAQKCRPLEIIEWGRSNKGDTRVKYGGFDRCWLWVVVRDQMGMAIGVERRQREGA